MDAQTQLFAASILGAEAFNRGIQRAPGLDESLMSMISDRKNWETPKGEASSMAIMTAWLASWDNANTTTRL